MFSLSNVELITINSLLKQIINKGNYDVICYGDGMEKSIACRAQKGGDDSSYVLFPCFFMHGLLQADVHIVHINKRAMSTLVIPPKVLLKRL